MPRARWASTKPARPRSWPDAVRLAALACALAFAPLAARADFAGRVVGVVDGDTLTILDGSRQVRVRLWGIDAPERGQMEWVNQNYKNFPTNDYRYGGNFKGMMVEAVIGL